MDTEIYHISKTQGLVAKNVHIHGRRTSIRLEPSMWEGLMEISKRERKTMHEICSAIHDNKALRSSLTAAVRVFIMKYFHRAATESGHSRANHGALRGSLLISNPEMAAPDLQNKTKTTSIGTIDG